MLQLEKKFKRIIVWIVVVAVPYQAVSRYGSSRAPAMGIDKPDSPLKRPHQRCEGGTIHDFFAV